MQAISVTIGIPVRDLARSRTWYDRLLGKAPDLEPVPGIAEYLVGGVRVQLMDGEPPGGHWTLPLGVADLDGERERLRGLGMSPRERSAESSLTQASRLPTCSACSDRPGRAR